MNCKLEEFGKKMDQRVHSCFKFIQLSDEPVQPTKEEERANRVKAKAADKDPCNKNRFILTFLVASLKCI